VAVVRAETEDAGGVRAESHVKRGNIGGENKIGQQKKQKQSFDWRFVFFSTQPERR
jgi:hypothetical protein